MLNAFSNLFERENIPAPLVKAIHTYTLDCYSEYGHSGQGKTSRDAIKKLTHWITDYANSNNFKLNCIRLDKDKEVKIVLNKLFAHNRVVSIKT